MIFYTLSILRFLFFKNKSFIWESKQNRFKAIKKIISINIDLLIGIDRQKKILLIILSILPKVILLIMLCFGEQEAMEKAL